MKKRNEKIKKRINWQKPLIGLVFLIFVIIILMRFAELQQIASLLQKISWSWFAIALVLQFLVYASLAGLYKTILTEKRKQNKIPFWHLFRTAIAMVFVDHTLPSFSASGNILLYHAARKKKIKEGRASLLVALNVFLNFVFYFAVFIAGLIYLLISKQIISFQWIWLSIALIVIFFTLLTRILFTISGQHHFKAFIAFILKRWPKAQARTSKHLSELYNAKKQLRKSSFCLALMFAFFVSLFKIAAIGAVFMALGHVINLGVLITGYFITAFLSTVSYIRIGVYELAMTGAYTGLGIEYNLAFTATLLYRLIAFWLPLLLGFIFFRNLIKNKR